MEIDDFGRKLSFHSGIKLTAGNYVKSQAFTFNYSAHFKTAKSLACKISSAVSAVIFLKCVFVSTEIIANNSLVHNVKRCAILLS